jgi:hypothetical protein
MLVTEPPLHKHAAAAMQSATFPPYQDDDDCNDIIPFEPTHSVSDVDVKTYRNLIAILKELETSQSLQKQKAQGVQDEALMEIKEELVLLTVAKALGPTISQDEKTTMRSLKRPLETLLLSAGKRQKTKTQARKTKVQAQAHARAQKKMA